MRDDHPGRFIVGLDRHANFHRRMTFRKPPDLQRNRLLRTRAQDCQRGERVRDEPRRNLAEIFNSHPFGADVEKCVADDKRAAGGSLPIHRDDQPSQPELRIRAQRIRHSARK